MPKIPNQSTEARRAVGAALRQLRERRGMSQSAVAPNVNDVSRRAAPLL